MVSRDPHAELAVDPDDSGGSGRSRWLVPVALVAVGGFLGTLGRYWVGRTWLATTSWPAATFVVNIVGAFVLGLLVESLARRGADDGRLRRVRLFAGVGFCGAFTTYSSLAFEVTDLLRSGHVGTALGYAVGSVIIGFVAAMTGIALGARQHTPAAR